jgi:anti-anti-sigma factor
MSQATIKIGTLSGVANGHQVSISGQLDETNIDDEAKKIYELIEKGEKGLKVLFNLQGLKYMNSKSVGYLADWHGKVTALGGKMAIANAGEEILEVLNVVGLNNLIDVCDSVDKAKKALG